MSPDFNPEQNMEDQKDRLVSNVKQLMQLRDLIDELSSTTSNPKFLKINQHVNKLLSAIADTGDSIMDRPDLAELNDEMEQFVADAVEEAKQKIEEIKQKDKEKDQKTEPRQLEEPEQNNEIQNNQFNQEPQFNSNIGGASL